MPREILQPEGVFDPRPRYAHVAKSGRHVYVAGQLARDADGHIVGKGDIEKQARQVLDNIVRCLEAVGATLDDVVKLNVYSTDLDSHLPTIAKVRQEYFTTGAVPSTTVQVPRLSDPDFLLEIEAIAMVD